MPFNPRAATRLAAATLVLGLGANACYNDNASPFVHGAHNAPPAMGSTTVKAGGPMHMTETTATSGYGNSSGYAGGIVKETGVSNSSNGATSSAPTSNNGAAATAP